MKIIKTKEEQAAEDKESIICLICGEPILEDLVEYEDEVSEGFIHFRCSDKAKQPIVIDLQLIKSLRFQGKHAYADALLKTFRKSVDQEKVQVAKEMQVRDRKIISMNCRRLNICSLCKIEPKLPNITLCLKCRDIKRRKYKESVLKEKQRLAELNKVNKNE